MQITKYKLVVVILVSVVLLVVGVCGFHRSESRLPFSITTVSSYFNDVYGISFQYPSNLHVLEEKRNGNNVIQITPYLNTDNQQRSELGIVNSLMIVIHDQSEPFEKTVDIAKKSMGESVKKYNEVIVGIEAVHLSYLSSFAGEEHSDIFIPCDKSIPYFVEITYVSPLREEYKGIIKSLNVCKKSP